MKLFEREKEKNSCKLCLDEGVSEKRTIGSSQCTYANYTVVRKDNFTLNIWMSRAIFFRLWKFEDGRERAKRCGWSSKGIFILDTLHVGSTAYIHLKISIKIVTIMSLYCP